MLGELHGRVGCPLQRNDGRRVVRSAVAHGNVRGAQQTVCLVKAQLDKLSNLWADGGSVQNLCHIVYITLDTDCGSNASIPPAYPGLVINNLRKSGGQQGNANQGEHLIDKLLVCQQAGYHGLAVIAVPDIVPVDPNQGIKGIFGVISFPENTLLGCLDAPDGPRLPVPEVVGEYRNLVI